MSRPISAAFGKGSGRARGTLKTQTGGLENPDGRSGRAQAELAAEECTRRRRSSHIDALLTVPITTSCWVGFVDKAGALPIAARHAHERDQRERKRGGNRPGNRISQVLFLFCANMANFWTVSSDGPR